MRISVWSSDVCSSDLVIHTKRCASRVTGRLGTKRRCKRTAELITPGDWWHCWQHERPGQTVPLWFGAHPRDLHVVHYWVSETGLAMRLCDGDNTEDVSPPTHEIGRASGRDRVGQYV